MYHSNQTVTSGPVWNVFGGGWRWKEVTVEGQVHESPCAKDGSNDARMNRKMLLHKDRQTE